MTINWHLAEHTLWTVSIHNCDQQPIVYNLLRLLFTMELDKAQEH